MLIVDDDEQIHAVTKMVLSDFSFRDRPLQFLSAHSGREGYAVIAANPDLAVIFLDVVMETETAGLDLARDIRGVLGNEYVRIILRTGQPGQAPERRVIVDYDINDYKEKSELTSQKLFSTMVTTLRSYKDIMTIEVSRRGLEKIIARLGVAVPDPLDGELPLRRVAAARLAGREVGIDAVLVSAKVGSQRGRVGDHRRPAGGGGIGAFQARWLTIPPTFLRWVVARAAEVLRSRDSMFMTKYSIVYLRLHA